MDFDKLTALGVRVFFFAAFALLAFGGIRFIAAMADIMIWPRLESGRVMDYTAACLLFAVALLLRQIRDELRKS